MCLPLSLIPESLSLYLSKSGIPFGSPVALSRGASAISPLA